MARPHIEHHIRAFLEELKTYKHYFDITFREQERLAKAIQDKHDEIGANFDYEHDDDGTVWSRSHDDVLGSDEVWITEHELFIIGGYCIIIFHAFERFLEEIFDMVTSRDLAEMLKEKVTSRQKKAIEKVLKEGKLDQFSSFCDIFPETKTVKAYGKVDELRIVCNVFKHGKGHSLEELKKIRPDITKPLSDGLFFGGLSRPFRGYGLHIKREVVYEYVDAIKAFLFEVFDIE